MAAPNADPLEERLVRIEMALAHMQQDIDSLNASLTAQFGRIQGFESRFSRLEHELESLNDSSEARDPNLERPPHY